MQHPSKMPAFNILAATRTIEAAGLDRAVAEAIAEVTATAATHPDRDDLATKSDLEPLATKSALEHLATKEDLAEVKLATKSDLAEVKLATKSDLADVKADLRWMKAIGGAIVVLLIIPLLSDLLPALFQTPL
ncbi:MAG: hypothetical protein GDA55_07140 [Cellvibrionales bacterium]|nr:hypothetical protein [Cellvibrionales bacterium]